MQRNNVIKKSGQVLATLRRIGPLTVCLLSSLWLSNCSWLAVSPPKEEFSPSWAPDSRHLVYECYLDGPINEGSHSLLDFDEGEGVYQSFYNEEATDLCVSEVGRSNQRRIVQTEGRDWKPVWSPDGTQIAYLRWDGIYIVTPDGRFIRQLVVFNREDFDGSIGQDTTFLVWSPDGTRLLFSACLDDPDRDIYTIDVKSGQVVNLTPESRQQEIMPHWTLDGTKIVYVSTNSSMWSATPCSLQGDAPHQLRVMDSDGWNSQMIDVESSYYSFVSVSNDGRILFITDEVSKTQQEFSFHPPRDTFLYQFTLTDGTLTQLPTKDSDFRMLSSWSPDGEYIVYEGGVGRPQLLHTYTSITSELPVIKPSFEDFAWSPDSQRIAVTVAFWFDHASEQENHIYIFDVQNNTTSPLLLHQRR